MKRKALAVAVGALFVAPVAQAQITFGNDEIGTMQIYGKLYPQYQWSSTSGTTQPGAAVSTLVASTATSGVLGAAGAVNGRIEETPPRQFVQVGNSYIGFRGERALGRSFGGLKGIWQIEQSTNFDVGNGTFASRNSFVGLSSGAFGTVKLGNMDTVYKEYGDTMAMFGISSGNFTSGSNVLSQSISSAGAARFHERRNNSVMYETPTFSGFTGGLMYGPAEDKSGGAVPRNLNFWSYGVKWDTERFYASVHGERHEDAFGLSSSLPAASPLRNNATGTAHSVDKAVRASGNGACATCASSSTSRNSSTTKAARAALPPRRKPRTTSTRTTGSAGRRLRSVALCDPVHQSRRGFMQAHVGHLQHCRLGAKLWTVGARWRFDRQTFVYAIGATLRNGVSASYNNNSSSALLPGSDTKNFALGVSYSF